jgi:hypothetical protein
MMRQMSITKETTATRMMIHNGIALSSTIGGKVVGGSVVVVCLREEDMMDSRAVAGYWQKELFTS